MKSITIHGIDDLLAARLKQVAEAAGTSMNRTVKRLLAEAVGVRPKPRGHNREQFEGFCGEWTGADLELFRHATAELGTVDESDWQ